MVSGVSLEAEDGSSIVEAVALRGAVGEGERFVIGEVVKGFGVDGAE